MRLVALGYLKRVLDQGRERYIRAVGTIASQNYATTNRALKIHQLQIIDQAKRALELPLENRLQQSVTIAIDRKNLDSAKRMIQDFLSSLSGHPCHGNKDSIYQISFSLFPTVQAIPLEEL